MSDRDGPSYRDRSRSGSPRQKREHDSPVDNGRSRDVSRSRSPDPRDKKSISRSPSRGDSPKRSSRDGRDRSNRPERDDRESDRDRSRYKSRSRSRSPRRYKSRKSRSYSGERRHSRSRSYSPQARRYRGYNREKPKPSRCIGIFGLSKSTTERQIYQIFAKYGPIDKVSLIIDAKMSKSRGFAFVYYENKEDATAAKEACSGMEIDGRVVRVDYSISLRAHTPTPGMYMGKSTYMYNRYNDRRRSDRDDYYGDRDRDRYSSRGGDRDRGDYYRSSRRSPSPRYRSSRRYER